MCRHFVCDAPTTDPAELAAVCAAVVYESRGHDDDTPPALPTRVVREAVERLGTLWSELHDLETRHGLDITRHPDAGIVDGRRLAGRPVISVPGF